MQTRSGTAACGDVELFYEDLGDPADPLVLLIMGVGALTENFAAAQISDCDPVHMDSDHQPGL